MSPEEIVSPQTSKSLFLCTDRKQKIREACRMR